MSDTNGNTWGTLTPTGGLQVGENSFYIRPSGDIEQDSTNSAVLGNLTVRDLTVTGAVVGITGFATAADVAASGLGSSNLTYAIAASLTNDFLALGEATTNAIDGKLDLTAFQASQAMTNTLLRVPASGTTNVFVLIDGAGVITTQRVISITVQ
jgi:hypothetical protein